MIRQLLLPAMKCSSRGNKTCKWQDQSLNRYDLPKQAARLSLWNKTGLGSSQKMVSGQVRIWFRQSLKFECRSCKLEQGEVVPFKGPVNIAITAAKYMSTHKVISRKKAKIQAREISDQSDSQKSDTSQQLSGPSGEHWDCQRAVQCISPWGLFTTSQPISSWSLLECFARVRLSSSVEDVSILAGNHYLQGGPILQHQQ